VAWFGAELAVRAVLAYLQDDISGTARLDAEVDAIEALSPSPSFAASDVLEWCSGKRAVKVPLAVRCYSAGRGERASSSNNSGQFAWHVVAEVEMVPAAHVRVAGPAEDNMEALVSRFASALKRALLGSNSAGAVSTVQHAAELWDPVTRRSRVASAWLTEISHDEVGPVTSNSRTIVRIRAKMRVVPHPGDQ